jgi:hypothetical protein
VRHPSKRPFTLSSVKASVRVPAFERASSPRRGVACCWKIGAKKNKPNQKAAPIEVFSRIRGSIEEGVVFVVFAFWKSWVLLLRFCH